MSPTVQISNVASRGQSMWALYRPTKAFGTYIPKREFCAWLQFYCQVALFEPGTKCPRMKCGVVMDIFGNHLWQCEHESYRIWRQCAQVQLLFMNLEKAARHPAVEPAPRGQHRQPPDITRLPRGNNYFRYLELASSVRRKISKCTAETNPLLVLNAAWRQRLLALEHS